MEKLTRKSDKILCEVIVEDPRVLVEPWAMAPRTLRINPAPPDSSRSERIAKCGKIYQLRFGTRRGTTPLTYGHYVQHAGVLCERLILVIANLRTPAPGKA